MVGSECYPPSVNVEVVVHGGWQLVVLNVEVLGWTRGEDDGGGHSSSAFQSSQYSHYISYKIIL